jgi:hypothetical protein
VTCKETVLAKYPDAQAKCVQPEAHAAEAFERRLHWAVFAGPEEDAAFLGFGLTEVSAWAAACEAPRRPAPAAQAETCLVSGTK